MLVATIVLMMGAAVMGQHGVDFHDPHPAYRFNYGVRDESTGDFKSHEEMRMGDQTRGRYSLVEPDGSIRTVEYSVDGEYGGFNAVVHREPNSHPQQQQANPQQQNSQQQNFGFGQRFGGDDFFQSGSQSSQNSQSNFRPDNFQQDQQEGRNYFPFDDYPEGFPGSRDGSRQSPNGGGSQSFRQNDGQQSGPQQSNNQQQQQFGNSASQQRFGPQNFPAGFPHGPFHGHHYNHYPHPF